MNNALLKDGQSAGPLFAPLKRSRNNVAGRKYRIKRQRAKTAWCTWAECDMIYAWAKVMSIFTGEVYNVDHVVPLVHPLVCGLHCPANLRAVPYAVNAQKSNNHWPDMWGAQLELVQSNHGETDEQTY